MRTLLVVGSAPNLWVDLEGAKARCPDHEIMLVNGACAAVEDAQHVLAGHTSKAEQFAKARREAFPFALPWKLHASRLIRRSEAALRKQHPCVDVWWGPEMSSGATSAGKAALIGLAMGFDRIVLCGCPMDGSGYFPGESKIGAEIKQEAVCQRVGDPKKQQMTLIRRYRDTMKKLAETTFRGKVFSMSGFTREVLGAP